MSLTWAPGAYTLKNNAHKRVMAMEAAMQIQPEQQQSFNTANKRENNRRALRIRMERLSREIAKEQVAILDTNQKVIKATAIRTEKARGRDLRRRRRQQMQLRPTTSQAGSLASTARTDYTLSSARLNVSMERPETSSSSTSSSSRRHRRHRRRRRPRSDNTHSTPNTSRSNASSTGSLAPSSVVSDTWLAAGNDNQAPFSARRHRLPPGMDYVPMDFGGHADLLRTSDGPARVASYHGRRKKKLELKLKLAQKSKIPAFGRKQTDISRVPEKQAACSSLKYMDGPASGDIVRTRVPVSDVTSFVNFMINGAPFTRPLGEQHHLKMTTLVKEREVLHENLAAMGENAISKNNGMFGTWM